MAVVTDSVWIDILLAVGMLGFLVYKYMRWGFEYWDRKCVPNTKRVLFLDSILGKQSFFETSQDMYQHFYKERYFGCFFLNKPILVVKDVGLINKVLIKDFVHFYDRGGQPKIENDPLRDDLFKLKGQLWRQLRQKLTPTFSTGKLKGMFEQVSKCGDRMVYKLEEIAKKGLDIEPKEFIFEFTTDVISSCAFGIQMGPESVEFKTFKSAVVNLSNPSLMQFAKMTIAMILPTLAKLLGWSLHFGKDAVEYFVTLIKTTAKYRKENTIKRNDYLQLLLSLQEQDEAGLHQHVASDSTEDDVIIDQMNYAGQENLPLNSNKLFMTEERIVANSVIFLVAGSDSTSSTIAFTLLELSRNPEVQTRLQAEVDSVLTDHQGQWSYQTIKDMVYLDEVIQESLRLHPFVPMLLREVTEQYQVPDSSLVLEKGTLVAVPVRALHHDPGLHLNPELFKPERFHGNNFKPNSAFLPFGDGPRICIAMRFAVLEVKTALARIMSQFSVQLSHKTQIPLVMEPRALLPTVKGGMWLKFTKRE